MSDDAPSKTVEINKLRSSYNRESGKKTLVLVGILIAIVAVLTVLTILSL